MAVPPDVRDHAYRLFTEEVPDLLQTIESELLTLRQDRSPTKIYSLMRNAHSIKGGAASVELDAIATVAHRLETIFKALYSESLEVDADLEDQLLQAYDCLRVPLMQQVMTGAFDPEQALHSAESVFAQIEAKLGDILQQVEHYDVPTSAQMGVDMTLMILEVDVAEHLKQLSAAIATSSEEQVEQELRSQVELYTELAEILNKPGLGTIAEAVRSAVADPAVPIMRIAQEALINFQTYRETLLTSAGKHEIQPSAALLSFTLKANHSDTLSGEFITPTVIHTPTVVDVGMDAEMNLEMDVEDNISFMFGDNFDPADADFSFSSLIETLEEAQIQPENSLLEAELDAETNLAETNLAETDLDLTAQLMHPVAELSAIEPFSLFAQPTQSLSTQLHATQIHSTQIHSTQLHAENISITPVTTTTRVDSARLEQMNNLVDESIVQRSSLALDTDQTQKSVRELLNRFAAIERVMAQLRKVADRTLISSAQQDDYLPAEELRSNRSILNLQEAVLTSPFNIPQINIPQNIPQIDIPQNTSQVNIPPLNAPRLNVSRLDAPPSNFDSLEMDHYGALHLLLQRLQEEMIQLREQVDDLDLFTKRSNQNLTTLRKTLNHLQDDFTQVRMLPIGEVLNRFTRLLRDLSNLYQKPVELKLYGTEVLVDKAVIERIADPLVHLVRNAFDHGIETPAVRRQQGKPEQGLIEIKVFHHGRQTIIEVKDDGAGLNGDRIAQRAVAMGILSPQAVGSIPTEQLFNLIFEPGFSTASQLSELSGRGVGLDVVRTQLKALKGTIAVTSQPGKGTVFTLCLPSTLTSDTLLVCSAGSTTLAFSFDSIQEICVPRADQVLNRGEQQCLQWRKEVLPIYRLAEMLAYEGPAPTGSSSLLSIEQGNPLGLQKSESDQAANPVLIVGWRHRFAALEVDQLITEQKLIIKPLGTTIVAPACIYGCTVLGNGQVVPVVDGAALIDEALERISRRKGLPAASLPGGRHLLLENQDRDTVPALISRSDTGLVQSQMVQPQMVQPQTSPIPKILVVDDAVSLRQTLSSTLESVGYRVLQAGDGWEAVQQLQQNPDTTLVISDIEMPNMNGFDFMYYRRQNPVLENIPLVILSSRSNDKHKRLAMHLGAVAYFTKPYIEQTFLRSIQGIVTAAQSGKSNGISQHGIM